MALQKKDFEKLGSYVKDHILEWIEESSHDRISYSYDKDLYERVVRVEEELKHQRELMKQGFEMMDKRFEDIRSDMNKRFTLITWFIGLGFTFVSILIAILKILP